MANSLLDPEYWGDTGNALAGLLSAPKRVGNALLDAYQTLTQPHRFDQVAADYIMNTPQRFRDNVNSAFPDPRLLNPNNQTLEARGARESAANSMLGFAMPINVVGMPDRGRDFLRKTADNLADQLRAEGFDAGVTHSGSAAGPSSYVNISDPQTARYFKAPIRISGHPKGPFESGGVWDMSNNQDFLDVIGAARKMRELGPANSMMQEEPASVSAGRLANALKKAAKGKGLSNAEQDAYDAYKTIYGE